MKSTEIDFVSDNFDGDFLFIFFFCLLLKKFFFARTYTVKTPPVIVPMQVIFFRDYW